MLNEKQSFDNVDGMRLNKVVRRMPSLAECYAYPHHQIYLEEDGTFAQTRSGPNFEGGVLTLTTCKHRLRTYKVTRDWVGVWFAGFLPKTDGKNYLLYLARVGESFSHNYWLGQRLKMLYPQAYEAKAAHLNPRGDIYHPRGKMKTSDDVNNVQRYITPKGHTRYDDYYKDGSRKWWRDIKYEGASGRAPAVFLFDDVYLFSKPMYWCGRNLGRSGYKTTINQLITDDLKREK